MATLRLFASLRELAGKGSDEFPATTLGQLFKEAELRYGPGFKEAAGHASLVLNGEKISPDMSLELKESDEVALLPPVSGGGGPSL